MSRKILLSVTGMTPQVVTETLYALAVQHQPAWIPDEIHIITTRSGAESARLNLLTEKDGKPGKFQQLRQDYRLAEITFTESHIHVFTDASGTMLDDIRTPEENKCAANFITDFVRRLTRDPASELHASIAGGRKTMGYFLGYAMSLFGRKQDRLSHVLVDAPYETNPSFFYVTPYSYPIQPSGKGMTVDARNAKIDLAEIPFVRLADGLPKRLMENPVDFTRVIESANREPALKIDARQKKVWLHEEEIHLEFKEFATLLWYADRKKRNQPIDMSNWDDIEIDYFDEFPKSLSRNGVIDEEQKEKWLAIYDDKIMGSNKDGKKITQWLKNYFRPINTDIRKSAENVLPERLAALYFRKERGNGDFLILDADRISITPDIGKNQNRKAAHPAF
ncbi:MAG: TIGR02584 family CRISPR-associated protein [Azoarcus sp.]|nr:TIGR02584 family CRISPR-associated protein [Azoarcus sp.]